MLRYILSFFVFTFFSLTAQTQNITYNKWQKLVPSDGLPKDLHIQNANNNLDLTFYHGRYYLVFRTAPFHFPSSRAVMYVLSSDDLHTWRLEHTMDHDNDLREPRFVIQHDRLLLYYFEGVGVPFKFEPLHLWATELKADQTWTDSKNIGLDGYVPWRLRTHNDTIFLSAYYGVGLYSAEHLTDLRLFVSQNGYDWAPLSKEPQIKGSSGEEGEFIFDEEGDLWATVRLESTGALIAHADKHHLQNWKTKYTKDKYDSALLFKHNDDVYLVSRRNMDGEMDKAPKWFSKNMRKYYNLMRYSLTKKKTALFKLNKETLELKHIMDFPSTGDTAFPAIVQKDENTYILMNYSSNIYDNERNWISGQLNKTYIYWTELRFEDNK